MMETDNPKKSFSWFRIILISLFLIILSIPLMSMLGAESSYQSISNADVVDGNTLRAEINYKTATIRLEGVQCPKKGEPGYEEAKSILEELTKEELLLLWGYSSDLAISSVKLKRYDGKDINKEVVRLGPCRALEGD